MSIQTPVQTPITGNEQLSPDTPLGALAEFYRAFNSRDLALMERNWLVGADIAMANPLGGVKRGWPAIARVYTQIFAGHGEARVAFGDYTLHESADLICAVGRETGALHGSQIHLNLAFRTTRLFRRDAGRWRQVHHHGSIDDPDLLRDYQAILEGLEGKRRRL